MEWGWVITVNLDTWQGVRWSPSGLISNNFSNGHNWKILPTQTLNIHLWLCRIFHWVEERWGREQTHNWGFIWKSWNQWRYLQSLCGKPGGVCIVKSSRICFYIFIGLELWLERWQVLELREMTIENKTGRLTCVTRPLTLTDNPFRITIMRPPTLSPHVS